MWIFFHLCLCSFWCLDLQVSCPGRRLIQFFQLLIPEFNRTVCRCSTVFDIVQFLCSYFNAWIIRKDLEISYKAWHSWGGIIMPFSPLAMEFGELWLLLVGCVAQWWNIGLWPANFPCPALAARPTADRWPLMWVNRLLYISQPGRLGRLSSIWGRQMSSRLQLVVCHLSLRRRHLMNAYEVKAGIGVIAGKTVWSMPERLACTTKMSTM